MKLTHIEPKLERRPQREGSEEGMLKRMKLSTTFRMKIQVAVAAAAALLLFVDGYSFQKNRRAALLSIYSTAAIGTMVASQPLPLLLLWSPESCNAAEDNNLQQQQASASSPSSATAGAAAKFQRYPQIRFIAALGDPKAFSGTGADQWGLWRDDPGPRGVYLRDYERQLAKTGVAPAGWTFQKNDWWLEEHGLIMSTPDVLPRKKFNKETKQVLPFKRYIVTGDREVTTILTVFDDGRWELGKKAGAATATLYDVTHLPCRSARYTTRPSSLLSSKKEDDNTCLPSQADSKNFPVRPGAVMPSVSGCNKQDYAILFVLGEEV